MSAQLSIMPGVEYSASRIVVEALGQPPGGRLSDAERTCVCCGYAIKPGELWAETSFQRSFVDSSNFAAPGSTALCGWCSYLITKDGLLQSSRGIFSKAGVTNFGKWLTIKAALLEPPDPPFVAIYATKQNQHIAWRARISFSRDLYYVQVGDDSLMIRRPILLKALDASVRLWEALVEYWQRRSLDAGRKPKVETEASKQAKIKAKLELKTIPHAFLDLSSDLKSSNHGVIHPKIYEIPGIREGNLGPDLRLLENLTLGELWAMRFITYLGASDQTGTIKE